jgi:hypothetical protein
MIRGALILTLGTLLPGCGTGLPDPVVRSVAPSTIQQGDTPLVRVEFDAVRQAWANFGREAGGVNTGIVIRIGGEPFFSSEAFNDDLASAPAPSGLKPGSYDVTVQLADGRQGTLPAGLTVTSKAVPTGFTIDPIGNQIRGQPFQITLHAEGGDASGYSGTVQLRVNKGTISPQSSGAFFAGSRVEWVTLNSAGKGQFITIDDGAGHQASSNTFEVNP